MAASGAAWLRCAAMAAILRPGDVAVISKQHANLDVRCWALGVLLAMWASGCSQADDAQPSGARRRGEPAAEDAPDPIRGLTQSALSAVWGSGPDDVWMVGGDGVILH